MKLLTNNTKFLSASVPATLMSIQVLMILTILGNVSKEETRQEKAYLNWMSETSCAARSSSFLVMYLKLLGVREKKKFEGSHTSQ